jgi:hypothetical protein
MPFDILSGDTKLREALDEMPSVLLQFRDWDKSNVEFIPVLKEFAHYPEERL